MFLWKSLMLDLFCPVSWYWHDTAQGSVNVKSAKVKIIHHWLFPLKLTQFVNQFGGVLTGFFVILYKCCGIGYFLFPKAFFCYFRVLFLKWEFSTVKEIVLNWFIDIYFCNDFWLWSRQMACGVCVCLCMFDTFQQFM